MELPERKPNRLKNFDYSHNGVYFITICTKDKECIFWKNSLGRPQLSQYGEIVSSAILNITFHYCNVCIDKYVIMPNHVHLLLRLQDPDGCAMHAPTISTIVQQMKGFVTRKIGFPIWQKSFHDHIIRNQYDYNRIWQYIDTNPLKWEEDCFYL